MIPKESMKKKTNEGEIPEGKISDYITGKWVKETEQEQVRQNFERTLVEEYQYPLPDIKIDFPIKFGLVTSKGVKKLHWL